MAKKSLSEQIAELTKPATRDYDIEDFERGVFDQSSDEAGSGAELDDDQAKNEHYVKVSKSKLRQNNIDLRDEKYKGKTSSRKAIFESEDDDQEDSDEHNDDDSDGEDIEEASDDEESDSLSEGGDGLIDDEAEEASDDEDSEGVADSEEETSKSASSLTSSGGETSDSESDTQTGSDTEEPQDFKRNKLKELMTQERKVMLNRISTSTQTDALKGFAVISQQRQFDNIIDARIKLQKAVQSANALPLNNETFEEFQESNSEELQAQATNSLTTLLDALLSLRTKIYNKEKVMKEPLKLTIKKRTLSEYLSETENLDAILKKNREQVLTKWSHKVQSASGAQALNASKFKALNQGSAQQVESNLMDMDRLVKRTRLNRRNVVPMGRIEDEEMEDDTNAEKSHIDRSLKEDPDVFDDEDFYRVLLNDLVNKKLTEGAPSGGLVITKTKVKKNVDTKASKGRKLKYTVQEPIQNYEAPNGSFKWDDLQIDEFFAGLLGQRVDFAEGSDDDSSEDEEKEMLKQDGVKLFG